MKKTLDSLGRPVKHGMYKTPEHSAWRKMKDRCYNENSQRYDRYGARGITVCDRWRDSFEAFFEDMGPRPSSKHSLDRFPDNDGNYEPGNVRWATRDQQNRNKSTNVILEFDGMSLTVSEWASRIGVNTRTLSCRLAAGWSVMDALTRPTEKRVWTRPIQGTVPQQQFGPTSASNRRVKREREHT